jgi:hypothetical protein
VTLSSRGQFPIIRPPDIGYSFPKPFGADLWKKDRPASENLDRHNKIDD